MPKPDATPGHRDSAASSEEARNAFAQHFKQSFAVLWTIAAGIVGDRAMAEDIVQEAALVGLNKFDQFQSGTSFTAWMGQVVRNVALNIARKEQRQRAGAKAVAVKDGASGVTQDISPGPSSGSDGSADLEQIAQGKLPANQRMFDDHVMKALSELGEAARACLLLRTLENMDYAEISKLLGIPPGTAMSHVHRARELMRNRLGGMKPPSSMATTMGQTGEPARKPA